MRRFTGLLVCAAAACALSASAATEKKDKKAEPRIESDEPVVTRGQGWSVYGGKTIGAGQNALLVDAGFPGFSAGVLHGASATFDIGARASFNYAVQDLPTPGASVVGFKLQLLTRFALLDTGRMNLALTLSPGAIQAFYSGLLLGFEIPVGLQLGLPISDALNVHAGVDIPFWVAFTRNPNSSTPFTAVVLPILFGGGLEYFIDRGFAITLNIKMGPSINLNAAGGAYAVFAFQSTLGVALKF